jgi:anti-sigma factor RsiW
MHDCRQMKPLLTDLVFDELPAAARLRVLAESADCAACQAEYAALRSLMRACDRATTAAQPPEDFWAGYHARLGARVQAIDRAAPEIAPATAVRSVTRALRSTLTALRRACNLTWRVPVPVAGIVLLALLGLSALVLLRPTRTTIVLAAPAQPEALAPVRTVAVPVVQRQIVTRTVYVTRRAQAQPAVRPVQTEAARSLARRKNSEHAPHVALAGFQPAGEVKLRIIKGSFTHEQ